MLAGCGVVPEDRHALACVTGMNVAENIMLDRLDRFRRFGLLDRAAMRREALDLMQCYDVRAGERADAGMLHGLLCVTEEDRSVRSAGVPV